MLLTVPVSQQSEFMSAGCRVPTMYQRATAVEEWNALLHGTKHYSMFSGSQEHKMSVRLSACMPSSLR